MSSRYVELRCRSAFSFLQGASLPEELVTRAAELGYSALALGDREGVYGIPRFHKAALRTGLRPLVAAEAVIAGHPLLLLCETQTGYRNLCRLLTAGKMRTGRDEGGALSWSDLADHTPGLLVLTGGEEGAIGAALDRRDAHGAEETLRRLVEIFGPEQVLVELQIHLDPRQDRRNAALVALGRRHRLHLVATNDVRYAAPEQADLCDVLTCIRAGVTLDEAGTRLLRNAERYLKSPKVMQALFFDLPEAVDNTALVAGRCRFTLEDLGYRFPDYPVAPGQSQAGILRALVEDAAPLRFHPVTDQVRAQLDRELDLITRLHLEGYFLIVWDLIQFCKSRSILVQGRGSAANSAVCFALGITACDPLKYDLLFERFLSEERGEWPDIDLDLPSQDHREVVIQYIYKKYGAHGCAMTANAITYRLRSAVRDVGKAMGFSPEPLGKLSALLSRWGEGQEAAGEHAAQLRAAGLDPEQERTRALLRLVAAIHDLPRHLGQHSGGMVLCAGRLDEIVPLQPAAMPNRVVIQWDKDDCADQGLIKIDLLGLGMMAALEEATKLCPMHDGVELDLAALPSDDPQVYDMLCRADTIGVFQVESRAQMATLPRLRSRRFYDLVVEVALIRPGPILGKMVHSYLKRRNKQEEVTYPHPSLEPFLERTLGVPIFQEQVMRMAMVAAGFSGGQAEELRRAMGFKRSVVRMAALEKDLYVGMAKNDITGEAAQEIVQRITSFAQYGFPESHAISFALLAYASAYLRAHHPAVFFVALFNAQPMGFYQPDTLVRDAQRHGVKVLPVDVGRSDWNCTIEDDRKPSRAFRLGLRQVRGLHKEAARALVVARQTAPFTSLGDLRRRCPLLRADELEILAAIGALSSLQDHPSRREALWQVSGLASVEEPLLARTEDLEDASPLEEMTQAERIQADYRGTSLTVGPHPLALHREALRASGVLLSTELGDQPGGAWVKVAGVVIVRQRPGTAKGFFFLTLEDEVGISSVIVTPQRFEADRALLSTSPVVLVEGVLQKEQGVINVKGQRFTGLAGRVNAPPSHDFH